MTPETLELLIFDSHPFRLAEAIQTLSETQRRKLSKTAYQCYRQKGNGDANAPGVTRLQGVLTAEFAVLGLCPLSQAQRVRGNFCYGSAASIFLKVIGDRRPDWIDQWLEVRLADEIVGLSWQMLQQLIETGICGKPTHDGYVRLMVDDLNHWQRQDGHSYLRLSQRLLANPELLEDEIWRLFETATDAFMTTHEDNPQVPGNYESWPTALVKLAEQGHLDRQRLLDASLQALTGSMRPQLLSGLHKFHARLKPTQEEIAKREAAYRHLLRLQVGHVVGFALNMLKTLDKADILDDRTFLAEVTPVFALSSKSQPSTVLKMAQRIADRTPKLKAEAVHVASQALTHTSSDVQELALTVLETYAKRIDAEVIARLDACLDDLSVVLRPRAQALIDPSGDNRKTQPAADVLPVQPPYTYADLIERIELLEPAIQQRTELDTLLQAESATALPPPLPFEQIDVMVLRYLTPVESIATLDDLIVAVTHAVEAVDSADQIERLLDALSRLCNPLPADFQRNTAALLKRLREPQKSDGICSLSNWGGTPLALNDLLLTWLTGQLHDTPQHTSTRSVGPFAFIRARLRELTQQIARRQAAPLLAAPTHEHGWIDPVVLVSKARQLQTQNLQPMRTDLIQALLRLTPDRRHQARLEAEVIEGSTGRLLRWALGSEAGPTSEDKQDYPLWIAAGRARDPKASLRVALSPMGTMPEGPDAVDPATYTWYATIAEMERDGSVYTLPDLYIDATTTVNGHHEALHDTACQADDITPAAASQLMAGVRTALGGWLKRATEKLPVGRQKIISYELPTMALHDVVELRWQSVDLQVAWLVRWMTMVWPLNLDSTYVIGILSMLQRLDDNTAATAPHVAYLEPLLESNRPWSEMGQLLVCTGLLSRHTGTRGLAIDVLIQGINDSRAHPDLLADVLIGLAAGEWLKMNRLASSLGDVACVSPLHKLMVSQVVQRFLSSCSQLPRNSHDLLALLLDLVTELGMALNDGVQAVLKQVKGNSKAAKLARSLLAITTASEQSIYQQALLQAITTRIERAEQWQEAQTDAVTIDHTS
ncbi:MAG: DUF6493 family protein [bacterium]|nr:DUF6493 family protein [bacterium]